VDINRFLMVAFIPKQTSLH